jgi:mannose-6-phosphate isomerase-like protein (cupin superfamily)
MKISLAAVLAKLPLPATQKWPQGVWDVTALEHGTMSLVLFAPKHQDYQTPHSQDELCIVMRGKGTLLLEGKPIEFETGDVLFVPADKVHRFVDFSDDLMTWAVFWGPEHGEKDGARKERQ